MPRVYIALGSNIEPAAKLAQAARELRHRFPDIRFSGCFRNAAFGFEGEEFFNAVAGFDTNLSIDALIDALQAVEADCGRGRADPKWAPRVMDLDLLLYDAQVADTPRYRLPRPDLARRAYMLGPLAELAPGLIHPLTGQRIDEMWRAYTQQAHPLVRVDLDLTRA